MGRVVAPTRATLCAAGIIAFAVALRLLLNALGWPPDDGDEGAMGILRWHSRDEHSFEVVTASWLNEYSAYTWRYV